MSAWCTRDDQTSGTAGDSGSAGHAADERESLTSTLTAEACLCGDRDRREKERAQLADLVGKNLTYISQLEGLDYELYLVRPAGSWPHSSLLRALRMLLTSSFPLKMLSGTAVSCQIWFSTGHACAARPETCPCPGWCIAV